MSLYIHATHNQVFDSVIVPQNGQVLNVHFDGIVFVLVLSIALIVEFVVMACDHCVGDLCPDVYFVVVSIQYHVVARLSNSEMRIVVVDHQMPVIVLPTASTLS